MNYTITEINNMALNLIYMFFGLILIFQVFMVRSFQKYNDIMSVRKKMNVNTLYSIPISIILSSFFMGIVILEETNSYLSRFYFISFLFLFTFSFFVMFYCLLFFSYHARKEINKLHLNNPCKWYQDETSFYASILFIFVMFLPAIYMTYFNFMGELNIEKIKDKITFLQTLSSFYIIFHFFSIKFSRKHLDKVSVSYIDVSVMKNIFKTEHNIYKYYKQIKKNQNI